VDRNPFFALSGRGSSNKKIIVYAIIGIVAIAGVSAVFLRGSAEPTPEERQKQEQEQTIALQKQQFCGIDAKANSNTYVSERVLPSQCELPLGIAVDKDKVWYLSTKQGTLGSYSLTDGKFQEFTIPSWPARDNPAPAAVSMVFATRVDSAGNVWFTDDKADLLWRFNKANGTFDFFKSPAVGPISFDFDSKGNIYLVGVRSVSIFFGDISKMKPGTGDGFKEIKLPLGAFSGIDTFRVSSGSLAFDRERNVVWATILAYQLKGQIFRYDVAENKTTTIDLPNELSSPVGTVLDNEGNLWVTDHGTSTFFVLGGSNETIAKYVTSLPSPKVFGGSLPKDAVSWPYWMQRDSNDNIWFNQHAANRISKFDPKTQTLTEYWIPTQNNKLGNCPPDAQACGIANAIQFSIGPQNQLWFTEWSENKIGTIKTDAPIPISVSAPNNEVSVKRGDSAQIKIDINAKGAFNGSMVASGTFTVNGGLGNSTGIFSEQNISLQPGGSKQVSFVFTPASDVAPGRYTVLLGAQDDEVSVLKAVSVNVA
jgi:virginiamycin B lyase